MVVLGPTASGKTRLAVQLARQFNGEIISADSRQVFRGMDIGTGKDLSEYGDLKYHLIDIIDPSENFSLFQFQRECLNVWENILLRNKIPVMVGGTGLYIESILKGYRMLDTPENFQLRSELSGISTEILTERLLRLESTTHNTTDTLDRERLIRAIEIAEYKKDHEPEPLPDIRSLIYGIQWDRGMLRKRITERLSSRIKSGMIEEVQTLNSSGIPWERLDFFGLEYRFIARYLRGDLNRNDMFQKLNSAIHDFAKRQDTWFRRMERNGIVIHWLDGSRNPFDQAMKIFERMSLSCNVK